MKNNSGEQLKKLVHDLRGQIGVVKVFLKAMETMNLPNDIRSLHEAASNSMKRMIESIENANT